MNSRLKQLAFKKDTSSVAQGNNTNQSKINEQIFSKKVVIPNCDSDDEDDHNDIFAVLNQSTSFQVKQENSQGLHSDKNNTNKNSTLNVLQVLNNKEDINTVQTTTSNQPYSKMSKQEEFLYQEQENNLKKKLKKPLGAMNPVLMKFQNKQNNTRVQIQQQNEVIEPKMEEEQGLGDEQQEQKMLKKDKSVYNIQNIESEQQNNLKNNSNKLQEQATPNKRQFSVSVNNNNSQSNSLNDSNSSQQLIIRIQGKSNESNLQNTIPINNDPKNNQNNTNGNVNTNGSKERNKPAELEEEDDDDDIEHLKSILISTQKSQNNQQIPKPQQITSKQTANQQFSIFPMMNDFDEQQVKMSNQQKNTNVNKQETINIQQQKKQDIDLSIFDALFDVNQDKHLDDQMEVEKEDKKSAADLSMFIQIQQDFEEEIEGIPEIAPINSNKQNSAQQVQQKATNNATNGFGKGLQNLLKKSQDAQNNNNLQINNKQNSLNSLQKPQNSNNQLSNNIFSKDQLNTNGSQQNNQSKVQSLLIQNSQPKVMPNNNTTQNKPPQQQLQSNVQQSIQNKNDFPNIKVNNQPLNNDNDEEEDDDEEEIKNMLQKQIQQKQQFPKQNILNKFGLNNKPQETNLNTSSSLSSSFANQSIQNQNKSVNNLFKTPVQNSKVNNYQTKLTQYTPQQNQNDDEDSFYQNFESSYQNIMYVAKPNNNNNNNNKGNLNNYNNNNNNPYEESMDLSKGNMTRMMQMQNSSYQTTAKKQTKKQVPQVTPYKINLLLYQKKKKMKQSVDEYKMYNLTSQQFELKLANSQIPKELKEYNIRQIFRGGFNNKKIPFLTVIMIEFEILHQIIKATLLDFSCSIIGSFSKSLFMDDKGESNQNLIVKKEEPEDEENEGEEQNDSDDDFIQRPNKDGQKDKAEKKKEIKMDFSTVYTLNHERGTQISLKMNTLFVLKDVTVIQQNEEPPFLNISEKNVVQVVYPF